MARDVLTTRLSATAVRAILLTVLVCGMPLSAFAKVSARPWGASEAGIPVTLYTLTNAHGMSAEITNFGGILVSVSVPDRKGQRENVVENYADLAPYFHDGAHYGALIGRYANRIAGARFVLHGKEYPLTTTGNATVQSHGGPNGYFRRVWDARVMDGASPSLELSLTDPAGEMGFPGTVQVTVRYTLTADDRLRIEYRATTDSPTVINLTNHTYFKLQGDKNGMVDRQILHIEADKFLPTDPTGMPTGEVKSVAGTDFDFRTPQALGPRLASSDPQITAAKGYDHTFVINGKAGRLRRATRLTDEETGRTVEIWTTQPGVQVYTANSVRPAVTQSRGFVAHGAVAFEAQHYPNSPNVPAFPSTEITPAKPLHEVTEFRFSTK